MIKVGSNSIDKIYAGSTEVDKAYLGNDLMYEAQYDETDYLCFQSQSPAPGSSTPLTVGGNKSSNHIIEYSFDKKTWTSWSGGSIIVDDKVYIRGILRYDQTDTDYTHFNFSGHYVTISGNLNTLWDYTDLTATLKDYCGLYLFNGNNLIDSAEDLVLPAAAVPDGGYWGMFANCSNLSIPPIIQAVDFSGHSCCAEMFSYCNLTKTPELNALQVGESCFYEMFRDCVYLTIAPSILPATTLEQHCYEAMFRGCTNLMVAPILPALYLAPYCYDYMFEDCSNLIYIKCDALYIDNGTTTYWVSGVPGGGLFVQNDNAEGWVEDDASGIPSGYVSWIASTEPLHFTNRSEQDVDIVFNTDYDIYASINDPNGYTYIAGSSMPCPAGAVLYIKGTSTTQPQTQEFSYEGNGKLSVSGHLSWLWDDGKSDAEFGQNVWPQCGYGLFTNCNNIIDASYLLFPDVICNDCYTEMFAGCESLFKAPNILPVLDLTGGDGCYAYMFASCTSLKYAPELPATVLADGCYLDMFNSCMSLEVAPDLNALSLYSGCYDDMFSGCEMLRYIKCLTEDDPMALPSTSNWVMGVSSSGEFFKRSGNNDWLIDSYEGIPPGWTVQDVHP